MEAYVKGNIYRDVFTVMYLLLIITDCQPS